MKSNVDKLEVENSLFDKVVKWSIRLKTKKNDSNSFKWSHSERKQLTDLIEEISQSGKLNKRMLLFFQSIVNRGLNEDDIKMFYKYRHKLGLAKFNWTFSLHDFYFGKKHALLKKAIPAGFYMLEFFPSDKVHNQQVIFQAKNVESNKQKITKEFPLNIIPGMTRKRLIYLTSESKIKIIFDSDVKNSEVINLNLVRLTKTFFISRLYSKLGISTIPARTTITELEIGKLWEKYNNLFLSKPIESYDNYINYIEPLEIIDSSNRLKKIKLWRHQ